MDGERGVASHARRSCSAALVGASAVIAAARTPPAHRARAAARRPGLAAFEQAPCYRETSSGAARRRPSRARARSAARRDRVTKLMSASTMPSDLPVSITAATSPARKRFGVTDGSRVRTTRKGPKTRASNAERRVGHAPAAIVGAGRSCSVSLASSTQTPRPSGCGASLQRAQRQHRRRRAGRPSREPSGCAPTRRGRAGRSRTGRRSAGRSRRATPRPRPAPRSRDAGSPVRTAACVLCPGELAGDAALRARSRDERGAIRRGRQHDPSGDEQREERQREDQVARLGRRGRAEPRGAGTQRPASRTTRAASSAARRSRRQQRDQPEPRPRSSRRRSRAASRR